VPVLVYIVIKQAFVTPLFDDKDEWIRTKPLADAREIYLTFYLATDKKASALSDGS
jgi:hypothetical protein